MKPVLIIDNGGANLASVRNACERLGAKVAVSADSNAIQDAERVILPGVGAAGEGMKRLRDAGLEQVVPTLKQPVLAICLGMQLCYEQSAEGDTACLGIFPGVVSKLPGNERIRVPHMGWNRLAIMNQHPLLDGVDGSDWFYFVHGFAAPINGTTLADTEHGECFAAVAGRDNFVAVQFHPERSANSGARLLQNFLNWDGCN